MLILHTLCLQAIRVYVHAYIKPEMFQKDQCSYSRKKGNILSK